MALSNGGMKSQEGAARVFTVFYRKRLLRLGEDASPYLNSPLFLMIVMAETFSERG